jgi:predicted nucleic acid-binding protein
MWFKDSRVARTLLYVASNHELVLCDRNIAEMRTVIKRKTPNFLADTEVFLAELPYELIPSIEKAEKLIRDPKDQPILNAAIVSGIDVILTGDKDFLSLNLDCPKPMTIAQFLKSEGVEL